MKNEDEELRELHEWLGMQLLMTNPNERIEISHTMAVKLVAILSKTPAGRKGRPKQWTAETEIRAVVDLLDGAQNKVLARAIARETGQPESSAERRLRSLKQSRRYWNWKRV